jgi:FMN phosphatase YigB (HAD superfamily)
MKYYLALDIGNVLCRVDLRKFTFAVSKAVNLSTWEVGHIINRSQRLQDVGLLTMGEILESEFNIKSSVLLDELINIWNNEVVTFDKNVFDFFSTMSKQYDLNIALLSNIGTDHAVIADEYIKNIIQSEVFADAIRHYSCNVGVRKPQSLFFQSFLLQHPEFQGCVYLDDREENLIASKPFGFQEQTFDLETITNLKASLEYVENLLLEPKEEKNSRWH